MAIFSFLFLVIFSLCHAHRIILKNIEIIIRKINKDQACCDKVGDKFLWFQLRQKDCEIVASLS